MSKAFAPSLLSALLSSLLIGSPSPVLAHADTVEMLEQEKRSTQVFKAWFPSHDVARRAAISLHGQLLENHFEAGYQIFELDPIEQARLRAFGFRLEPASDYIAARNARLTQLQKQARLSVQRNPSAIPSYACYETVEETFAQAEALAAAKPNLASWIDIGDSWLKTQGAGGHDLKVLKLTNAAIAAPAGQSKPKLFVNAAIHAREYATAPLVLEFAKTLLNGHGSDADATWVLDHHEVHLLLQTNPDGRKRAETGLSWRKNVNNNHCANTNTRGVDLNRNFTHSWNVTNGQGSSGSACNLTYRGPSAGSEPETQTVENYIRSLWPDRRGPNPGDAAPADTSGIHLDIHSFSQLVLWPWGDTTNPAPNGAALATLGRKFAWFNGYAPMQSVGLYPTDGTSDSPSYGELGVAAYTFEIGTAFFESCASYNANIKPGNLPALLYAAKVVRTPYLSPAGPDVTSLSLVGGNTVLAGSAAKIQASATDLRFNQSNGSEATQAIAGAEAFIGTPPWLPGAVAIPLSAADGSFDSPTEALAGSLSTAGLAAGKHLVYLRARDTTGQWGAVSALFMTVSDGSGGFEPSFGYSCAALRCEFKAGTAPGQLAQYRWDFGDGGQGNGQGVTRSYAQAGSYEVTLTVQSGAGSSSVKRQLTVFNSGTVDEQEPNNSRETAQPLVLNPVLVNGTMASNSDSDWFTLLQEPGKTLVVTLRPNASSDYELIVYDANGNELARSENGTGAAETISLPSPGALSARRYVRAVYYSGGTGATNGRYTLNLEQ